MADLCPLTLAEARSILIADDALALSYVAREECGKTLGIEELDAWTKLVESARARIAGYEQPVVPIDVAETDADFEILPYPGGNEPGFQTLFLEAIAASEAPDARKKTP